MMKNKFEKKKTSLVNILKILLNKKDRKKNYTI
jgi:hypothetical protein